jgi:hypothetical protein
MASPYPVTPVHVTGDRIGRRREGCCGDVEGCGVGEWIERCVFIDVCTHHWPSEVDLPWLRRRITFQRMPTAPSVPQRHQSYGYEEGEAGELIMQFPADRGHTGRPGDTVGPAKYTPSIDAASAKGPKAVSWSKSRSQRTSGMGVGQALDGPGPGAYQPPGALADSVPDASLQAYDPLNPNLPSSSFASRVPLKHQQLVDEDSITPGPGSYAPVDQFRKRRVPEAHQFFGSTALRPYQVRAPQAPPLPFGGSSILRRESVTALVICLAWKFCAPPSSSVTASRRRRVDQPLSMPTPASPSPPPPPTPIGSFRAQVLLPSTAARSCTDGWPRTCVAS